MSQRRLAVRIPKNADARLLRLRGLTGFSGCDVTARNGWPARSIAQIHFLTWVLST